MNAINTPDQMFATLRAIEVDIAAGRMQQATGALNAALAAAPSDPRAYLTAAVLAQAANNSAQELQALQRAVEIAPRWWPAYAEFAKALARHERYAPAHAAAAKVVELAPREMGALEVAVAVSNSIGDSAGARRYLEMALALRPDDLSIRRTLGMVLEKLRLPGEAIVHWQAILAVHPEDISALGWLGICYAALGRTSEAIAALEKSLQLNPDHPELRFHLAIARGETPPQQPLGTVQQLFDDYAGRFDAHLQGTLNYRLPERVAQLIRSRHPALDADVLDLGCGTGLLGAQLGAITGALVGVDLSRNMLEKASRLNVYRELRQNDLLAELGARPAMSFDYVTANDVFIYVGQLSAVIPAMLRVLRAGGLMIFSCETALESEGALVLRPSKRYAHSRSSVERMCREAGARSCKIEEIDLRTDGEAGVIRGFTVIAEK